VNIEPLKCGRREGLHEIGRGGGRAMGDEGKARWLTTLRDRFDYIARVAGGHNAGHTSSSGKDRYVLQLISVRNSSAEAASGGSERARGGSAALVAEMRPSQKPG